MENSLSDYTRARTFSRCYLLHNAWKIQDNYWCKVLCKNNWIKEHSSSAFPHRPADRDPILSARVQTRNVCVFSTRLSESPQEAPPLYPLNCTPMWFLLLWHPLSCPGCDHQRLQPGPSQRISFWSSPPQDVMRADIAWGLVKMQALIHRRCRVYPERGQRWLSMDHMYRRRAPVSLLESSLEHAYHPVSTLTPEKSFQGINTIMSLPCLKSLSRQIQCQDSQHWLQISITWKVLKKPRAQAPVQTN